MSRFSPPMPSLIHPSPPYLKDTDFDRSVGLDLARRFGANYRSDDANQRLDLLRLLYQNNLPSIIPVSKDARIPKIIHQIWLGPNTIPDLCRYYMMTWKKHHPDWEYRFWTDHEAADWVFQTRNYFDQARSYAEKADILRYELLRQFGGLYVDVDTICFAPFDELHHKYDFYAGMEPIALTEKTPTIANNIIASVAGHTIIDRTIEIMQKSWYEIEKKFDTKTWNSGSAFHRSVHNLAVKRTMHPLSQAVFETARSNTRNVIIFPGGYFHPFYYWNRWPLKHFIRKMLKGKPRLDHHLMFRDETIAFHNYYNVLSLVKRMGFYDSLFENSPLKANAYRLLCGVDDGNRHLYEMLYEQNFPTELDYNLADRIPRIIHCVWLEHTRIPQPVLSRHMDWRNNHPDWEFKAWGRENIEELLGADTAIFRQARNTSDQSALVRLFALRRFGGVSVDNDVCSIRSLNELVNKYGFFVTVKFANGINARLSLSTKVIGSVAKGAVVNYAYQRLLAEWKQAQSAQSELPSEGADGSWTLDLEQILTEGFNKFHALDGKTIAFPGRYFLSRKRLDESFAYIDTEPSH